MGWKVTKAARQEAGRDLQKEMASRQKCEHKEGIRGWLYWVEWWERR